MSDSTSSSSTMPRKPPFSACVFALPAIPTVPLKETKADLESLLPPLYHDRQYKLQRTRTDIHKFLRHDLSLERLNGIHGCLFLAGRPQPARPLHRQLMMSRKIVVTEQIDLHLTWNESRIYIKPLPRYLLSHTFWEQHLCEDEVLYADACGLLLSYLWLITYESDFQIATDEGRAPRLLPHQLTWGMWSAFSEEYATDLDLESRTMVNKRYEFGELRLGRLNKIYRFAPRYKLTFLIRGYHTGYNQYGVFFQRNFAWLIIVFAYFSIVLTAMQLGVATDYLVEDKRFQKASYGFAIFSVIVPLIVLAIIVILFLILVVNNAFHTLVLWNEHRSKILQGDKGKVRSFDGVV